MFDLLPSTTTIENVLDAVHLIPYNRTLDPSSDKTRYWAAADMDRDADTVGGRAHVLSQEFARRWPNCLVRTESSFMPITVQ